MLVAGVEVDHGVNCGVVDRHRAEVRRALPRPAGRRARNGRRPAMVLRSRCSAPRPSAGRTPRAARRSCSDSARTRRRRRARTASRRRWWGRRRYRTARRRGGRRTTPARRHASPRGRTRSSRRPRRGGACRMMCTGRRRAGSWSRLQLRSRPMRLRVSAFRPPYNFPSAFPLAYFARSRARRASAHGPHVVRSSRAGALPQCRHNPAARGGRHSTARGPCIEKQRFVVTHPFHPLHGREFELIDLTMMVGVRLVHYTADDGALRTIREAFTRRCGGRSVCEGRGGPIGVPRHGPACAGGIAGLPRRRRPPRAGDRRRGGDCQGDFAECVRVFLHMNGEARTSQRLERWQ